METLTAKENRKQKIKTHFARIKLGGTPQKPYFYIDYFDPADGEFHEGFGSYEFRNVEQWLKEEFEIVNNPPKTTNDEVERKNDEIEFVKVEHEEAEQTIKDSGTRRQFDTGAVRDMAEGKGRCDLLPASAILRLARHFENGCKKYGDRNWEQGIPVHSFIDSAIRHLMKYLDGWTDEDHLCAAAWNCMCAMWTEEHKPELVDIPTRPEYRRRETD